MPMRFLLQTGMPFCFHLSVPGESDRFTLKEIIIMVWNGAIQIFMFVSVKVTGGAKRQLILDQLLIPRILNVRRFCILTARHYIFRQTGIMVSGNQTFLSL